jgi:hypothetical protein
MIRVAPIGMFVFALGGCSADQPINAWQQRFTDYTMKQGNGDPSVLRESAELRSTRSIRPAQIRFDHDDIASPGLPPFVDRFDVHGVLVGQHTDGRNPTFFFLVGVVERPYSGRAARVEDVRLVSCTVRDRTHHWKTANQQRQPVPCVNDGRWESR